MPHEGYAGIDPLRSWGIRVHTPAVGEQRLRRLQGPVHRDGFSNSSTTRSYFSNNKGSAAQKHARHSVPVIEDKTNSLVSEILFRADFFLTVLLS